MGIESVGEGVTLTLTSDNSPWIARTFTNENGEAYLNAVPAGKHEIVIKLSDGKKFYIPLKLTRNTNISAIVFIYDDYLTGRLVADAKTFRDNDRNWLKDDSYSYAVYGREEGFVSGGTIILHQNNLSSVDIDGDGDFLDPGDRIITEPDDDGVSSEEGDGDEDNDGIRDIEDGDIDGDGTANIADDDVDGDGQINREDDFPNGVTPEDDFNPPVLKDREPYTGIEAVNRIDDVVTVYFPQAIDREGGPVAYVIFCSENGPVDFEKDYGKIYIPAGEDSGDSILSCNLGSLIAGKTYHIAVRARDSAHPPNEDDNTREEIFSYQ